MKTPPDGQFLGTSGNRLVNRVCSRAHSRNRVAAGTPSTSRSLNGPNPFFIAVPTRMSVSKAESGRRSRKAACVWFGHGRETLGNFESPEIRTTTGHSRQTRTDDGPRLCEHNYSRSSAETRKIRGNQLCPTFQACTIAFLKPASVKGRENHLVGKPNVTAK